MRIFLSAPATWNDASLNASTEIQELASSFERNNYKTDVPYIRHAFEHLSGPFFHDSSDASKELVFSCWKEIGGLSLYYAKRNEFEISLEHLASTLVRKQRDYGHNNISKYGRQGLIIRVHDKIARLENLTQKQSAAANEPIEDTLLDIAGYSAIGMMWESGTFLLPLE
jgi:hypothetical protein